MKTFSHTRPIRDEAGNIISQKPGPAVRVTNGVLPKNHGRDKDRRLVVSLEAGDIIRVRIERTSLARSMAITAVDLWMHLQRCAANRLTMEKARVAKQRKAERLIEARENRKRAQWKREAREQ